MSRAAARTTARATAAQAAAPDPEWVKTALNVTGFFEDSEDPWGGVSGDFDGMGISLGVLQWNIGSSSLQPMVRNVGRAIVVQHMPHYGVDLWNACDAAVPQGLRIVRAWQNGSRLRPAVAAELKAFAHSPEFIAEQVKKADNVALRALNAARSWANDDPAFGGTVSKQLFCWFFDLITQNGGLKNLTYADVRSFINGNGASKADDVICDWLANRTSADAGYRDSRKNGVLWRDKVGSAELSLFVLSYLRALKSRTEYRGDVLNRKATLALRNGWVHGELRDLRVLI